MDVLVVEDDDGVRENLAEFLADSGFQVEQAESAEDGLGPVSP
jgi:DNA-binding response OmpR family regulator